MRMKLYKSLTLMWLAVGIAQAIAGIAQLVMGYYGQAVMCALVSVLNLFMSLAYRQLWKASMESDNGNWKSR